jgi:hypothetical protein
MPTAAMTNCLVRTTLRRLTCCEMTLLAAREAACASLARFACLAYA